VEPFECSGAVERARNWPRFFASVALALASWGLFLGSCTQGSILYSSGGLVAAVGTLVIMTRQLMPHRDEGDLRADETGLSLNGVLVAERRALKEGYLQPRSGRVPLVRVRTTEGKIDVEVPSNEHGRALLAALGLDGQIASFVVRAGLFSNPRVQTAFAAGTSTVLWTMLRVLPRVPLVWWIAGVIALLALVNTLLPTFARVGQDGLLLRSLTKRRFFPFSQMQSAHASPWGVTLQLRSGKSVELRTRPAKQGGQDPAGAALLERLQAGIARAQSSERPEEAATLVRRGDRDVKSWLEGLRALRDGGYRVASLGEERLWQIVQDATAAPTARAGAALLLRDSLSDEGRARLRVAAQATVLPKVRVVLEAASDPDREGDLRAALEACTDEEELVEGA
jgi:hypothetical protein